jgi:HAD superfamily phosphatase (TIGR01668 family)
VRHWKSGDFDREKVSSAIHPFLPAHATESLESVNLEHLWARGKRLILLDVDNTIVRWKSEEFEEPVLKWVAQAKSLGFDVCIISNTNHLERLERIVKLLDVGTVRGRFKPSRAMFRLACIKYNRKPEEAIMIGDQIMTDVLGANRAGIDAIWVRRMEGEEYRGPLFTRRVERALTGAIYRALVIPEGHGPADPTRPTSTDSPVVKQLIRFAVVGGSAFVFDTSLKIILLRVIHVHGQPLGGVVGEWALHNGLSLPWLKDPESAAIPFLGWPVSFLMIFYTYFFNRLWTFEAVGKSDKGTQLRRFFAVAFVGIGIQNALFSVFLNMIPGRLFLAQVLSTVFQAAWNFTGQKLYAFRDRRA